MGDPDSGWDRFRFHTVKNIGRGTAINVIVGHEQEFKAGEKPTHFVYSERISILAPNESNEIDGHIDEWHCRHCNRWGDRYLHRSRRARSFSRGSCMSL